MFYPRLKVNTTSILVSLLIALLLSVATIFHFISIKKHSSEVDQACKDIKLEHQAYHILIRSIYNINRTYINEFHDNALLDNDRHSVPRNFYYKTDYNTTINLNSYYLLNVQIPSLLETLVHPDPVLSAIAKREFKLNYYNMIS